MDISGLPSGTYFAVILFGNDAIAGHGQFVVQK